LTLTSSAVLGYFAWRENAATAAVGAILGGALGVYWALAALRRYFKLFRLNKTKAG